VANTPLVASRPVEAEDADATRPFSALRVRALRARLLGNGRLATEPGLVAGAARGLLVTPWFAAATGFVVAAGLWIYAPHAELSFPPSALGGVPCGTRGCGITAGQAGGVLTTTAPQVIAPTAGTQAVGAHPASAAAGLKFSYSVLGQYPGKFAVLITVTGKRVPHTWKLRFTMPGDQISAVMGADWHASSPARGTASGPYAAVPGQYQGPGASGFGDASGSLVVDNRHEISFVVVGEGVAGRPTRCFFNGATCSFSSTGAAPSPQRSP
jgi:hypothetical protein